MGNENFIYFVEGQCEKKIIETLKNDYIISGKVYIKNLIEKKITNSIKMSIVPKTNIIIIFDTYTIKQQSDYNQMNKNISELKKIKNVRDIILIPQVYNLEDELIESTSIKTIDKLLNSNTKSEFKSDLTKYRRDNLIKRLVEKEFSLEKLWARDFKSRFLTISTDAYKIKILK